MPLSSRSCFLGHRCFLLTTSMKRIYDPDPGPDLQLLPGALPPETDSPLEIPDNLPRTTTPNKQERFDRTPIYDDLTTNVPDIAMSFSDSRFSYGPFAPHWVPRQYIANYFSDHRTDQFLVLNTTVEHLLRLPYDRWRLTLRRYDAVKHVDVWWEEEFDAVVVANGHYTVPYVSLEMPSLHTMSTDHHRFLGSKGSMTTSACFQEE